MRMQAGSREHVSHVAMLTPRTPLHPGRPSRVQRDSSSMLRAMEDMMMMIVRTKLVRYRNRMASACQK